MERSLVLQRNCPVNWDFNKCSSSEYVDNCRNCCNYNPLKIIFDDIKPSPNISKSTVHQDLMQIIKSNKEEFDFCQDYIIQKYLKFIEQNWE